MKLGYRLYIYMGYYFEFHQATYISHIQNEGYRQIPRKTKIMANTKRETI